MRFRHTNRPGFWFGLVDFCTFGLFFLFYMPLSGLQDELDYILGRRTQRYGVAYLLGIPTAFIYTLVWMARIAEELKAKAIELGIEGPYTSWWHTAGVPVVLLSGAVENREALLDAGFTDAIGATPSSEPLYEALRPDNAVRNISAAVDSFLCCAYPESLLTGAHR
ncbi:MAG: hypothetical protein J6W09_01645 [Bacteroidales bacterium]|nr:hypothetical protein [Bacteroidales bacterium]